jgi:hypothetical protein
MRFVPLAVVAFVLLATGVIGALVNPGAPVSEAEYEEPAPPAVSYAAEYDDGEYLIEGAVRAPNECHEAAASASLDEGAGEIRVAVFMLSADGICLEIPAELPFSASLAAPDGMPVAVYVNGIRAALAE